MKSITASLPDAADVLIVGAGPAGTTLAALLARYRPETNVLIIEKDTFPRHKVGEGLIVDINRILADMGALEAIEEARFPLKYGSTFLWGQERQPATFLFREAQGASCPQGDYQLDYTWHVDRPTYDKILLDCAVGHGARVVHGATVTDVVRDGERVVGAVVKDHAGREHHIAATWVIDCAGIAGPLTRRLGGRVIDEDLRNIALFAYHRNVGWRDELQGPPELRRTLILTHPRGWVWLIPVSATEASVGFVTSLRAFQAEKERRGGALDPAELYEEVLRELPEYDDLFSGSTVFDYRAEGRLVHTIQEFSFACERIHGPGWALCGDAAGFVDAILSIGCFVAQAHAQFLAYALASVLDGDCDPDVAFDSYATTVDENLDAFRAITHMFYAYNASRSDWWRESSSLLRQSALVPEGQDREAFIAFVSGFTARHSLYEEAVNSFGGMFLLGLGQSLFGEAALFDEEAADSAARRARRLVASDPVLRMNTPWTTGTFALPHTGTGRLRPVVRLEFQPVVEALKGQEIARRLYLPGILGSVPGRLDGSRSLRAIAEEISGAAAGSDPDGCYREVMKLAYRLARMGVVDAVSPNGSEVRA